MTELSPESKALIDLARGDDEPSVVDRVRVRRALGASLATGVALSSATSLAAGAGLKAAGASAGLAGTMKIAMWVGVGMAVGALTTTTAIVAVRGPSTDASSARPAPRETNTVVVADLPAKESPVVEPTDTTTIPLEVTSKPTASRPPQPSASSLAAEMRLLETARAALSGGDARRALALIQEHEREFPSGSLSEERRASKVFALCELGRRAEAARAAAEFLRVAPASPLRGRVLDSCAFPER
jgi:hypothetical protein